MLHDERLPQPDLSHASADSPDVFGHRLDETLDEGRAPDASVDLCRELGIERDAPFQQQRRNGVVTEEAGAHERLVDGHWLVAVLVERGANGVYVAERGQELERARQQTLPLK